MSGNDGAGASGDCDIGGSNGRRIQVRAARRAKQAKRALGMIGEETPSSIGSSADRPQPPDGLGEDR